MKSIKKTLISNGARIYYLGLWTILFAPSIVLAWQPGESLVPECAKKGYTDRSGSVGCHFPDIITLIDNLLDMFIWVTVPIATILIAWIGWIFVTQSDKVAARSRAKEKLMALLKGMFFVLAGWLIVKLIVSGFGAGSPATQFIK